MQAQLSAAKRAVLEARLRGLSRPAGFGPRPAGDLPLSFAQERLWFLHRLQGGTAYNLPAALRLSGALHVAALERALGEIVRRHEALRTTFRDADGVPVQVIAPFAGFALPLEDLSCLDDAEAEAARRVARDAALPFDLTAGPLFRAALLRITGEEHVLLLAMHHAVGDGWSIGVLLRELSVLYAAYREGRESPLPELPAQYADYALWQREQLRGPGLERRLAYWRERLRGAPALVELPADHPRPPVPSLRGAAVETRVSAPVVDRLRALAAEEGATLYMVLLAAFQVLVGRYAATDDVVVASPIAGRTRSEVEGLIGFFVNTLVLRTDLAGAPTFREVVRRVREVTLGAFEHQDVPFEKVVADLQPERSASHSPLFQLFFILQDGAAAGGTVAGLRMRAVEAEMDSAKCDLALSLGADGDGLRGTLSYSTDLFERATIERMAGHLGRVMEQAAADADVPIDSLELLGDAERRQVVEEWNRTEVELADPWVHQAVAEQAARTPDAVAVADEAGSLTYGELDRRANRLARHLVSLGAGPERRVGICLERGTELVVAWFAALKAGAAYVPVDPAYPAERCAYMLADSGVTVLVTRDGLRGALTVPAGTRVVTVDGDGARIAAESAEPLPCTTHARSLAYVIYTSGSTGTPKGAAVEHGGMRNVCVWHADAFGVTARDRTTQMVSPGFDAAMLEVWPYLIRGARVQVVPDAVRADPARLPRWLAEAGSTFACAPVPVVEPLLETEWPAGMALRWWMTGGDRLRVRPGPGVPFTLVNNYGPTEFTCTATCAMVGREGGRMASIGAPVHNARAYVLDGRMRPVPIGLPGELWLAGAQVARGYLGRPALTAASFLPDPFAGGGARMYRTGDRARWLADGTLEFLGRADEQVKIRGFRIEPGEIESVLRAHPRVRECAVVPREDRPGDLRLVAYVVGAADAETLREHLRRTLPDYMVPAAFVPLDALPQTANGKLDRRALPAPGYTARGELEQPRSFVEAQLLQVWEEVLGVETIGTTQNFFDELGGNSILALRLFAQVNRRLRCDLPVAVLFAGATVRQMAAAIEEQRRATPAPPSPVAALQPHGSLPPLFCVHPADRNVICYVNLVRHLGADQPVYGLRDISDDLARPIAQIAAEYVREVRAVQPRGPYYLAGWSFGGFVAFEMASLLEGEGERVAFVGLLDTTAPCITETRPVPEPLDLLIGLADDLAAERGRTFAVRREELEGLDRGEQLRRIADALQAQGAAPAGFGAERLQAQADVLLARARSLTGYAPGAFTGSLTLFRAEQVPGDFQALLAGYTDEEQRTRGWCRTSPAPVEVHPVPGAHVTISSEPHVRVLAQRMREALAAARLRTESLRAPP